MYRHGLTPDPKPTVNDIARVAGVSLATVDRVLNARPGVRSVTIERVNNAVAELGFVRDAAAASLGRRRFLKLLFILPETSNEFIKALEQHVAEQGVKLLHERVTLDQYLVPPFDPAAVVEALDSLELGQVDGVAVFGPDTEAVRDAVRRARARGVPVVALVADLSDAARDFFVGINNVTAGRTAAQLMAGFIGQRGRVLVITGSHLARDHLERRMGFEAFMNECQPDIQVVASPEGRDDPELICNMLPELFEQYPDIRGVYSSAAGNLGLMRHLSASTWRPKPVVIAHELTPSSREALASGLFDAIISQDAGHLIRSAVRLLKAKTDQSPIDQTQEQIRIDIYLKENMPSL